jgi:hypothetical protein
MGRAATGGEGCTSFRPFVRSNEYAGRTAFAAVSGACLLGPVPPVNATFVTYQYRPQAGDPGCPLLLRSDWLPKRDTTRYLQKGEGRAVSTQNVEGATCCRLTIAARTRSLMRCGLVPPHGQS